MSERRHAAGRRRRSRPQGEPERTLTRAGYRVMLASDGRAALERFQDGGIDLILTDLKMPGLTGLELLRAAKAITPDVDVILITAFGTSRTRSRR